jgi:hypothetical protein
MGIGTPGNLATGTTSTTVVSSKTTLAIASYYMFGRQSIIDNCIMQLPRKP